MAHRFYYSTTLIKYQFEAAVASTIIAIESGSCLLSLLIATLFKKSLFLITAFEL